MDIRTLPGSAASLMLGVAHELDEMAIDHGLIHGSTVLGRMIRFIATGLVVTSMPLAILGSAVEASFRRQSSQPLSC